MEDVKNDALAITQSELDAMMTTDRYTGQDEGITGAEGMTQEDIQMPRLVMAQKTSPELDPSQPEFVEGLKLGDFFNSLTKENYGPGPLKFSILRKDLPRWVEFGPFDEGGGVIDRDVKAGDPRTEWRRDPGGDRSKDEKPIATKFYDFVILLYKGLDLAAPQLNVLSFSCKGTSLKYVKKQLNTYIVQRGKMLLPKGVYSTTTQIETEGKLSWAVSTFENAGRVKEGSVIEQLVLQLAEQWKDASVKYDETPEPAGDGVPFPTTDDM